MRFIFSKLFYLLIVLGFIPLSLSWGRPWLRWCVFAYDVILISLAIIDANRGHLPKGVQIKREFGGRFAVGAETEVRIKIRNSTPRRLSLIIKDEYPPQMRVSGMREAKVRLEGQSSAALVYSLTPPKRGRFEFGRTVVRFR